MNFLSIIKTWRGLGNLLLLGFSLILTLPVAHAVDPIDIASRPLFLGGNGTPLALLVMGRDHKLYYEAYNDASDLNQDGEIDIGYKPNLKDYNILEKAYKGPLNYYGYFDSYKCYNYESSIFVPKGPTDNPPTTDHPDYNDKRCTKTGDYWSGDFLNYLTTSRMDALRRVLYGGYRSTDSATATILERARIPQDAHSWGKEYKDIATDGYDIREYTPLSLPFAGRRHLFANVSLNSDVATPLLRVLKDSPYRIWEWVAIERPVAGDKCVDGGNGPLCAPTTATIDTTHPTNHTEFAALITKFQSRLMGSSALGTTPNFPLNGRIDCNTNACNPYGSDDNYLTVFTGKIKVAASGTYEFSVDGNDAVEVTIDDPATTNTTEDLVVGWYGSHGTCGTSPTTCRTDHKGSITLTGGVDYTIRYWHEDVSGNDGYLLYWKGPDSLNVWQIVPTLKYQDLVISTYSRDYPVSIRTDYTVRVKACVTDLLESICKGYPENAPTVYKPTGLLHEYGETDRMAFGLLTGSFKKHMSGGVLRKNIASFKDEINLTTGQFNIPPNFAIPSTGSIVQAISNMRIVGFQGTYSYNDGGCAVPMVTPMQEGRCAMWGNPVAEMMYEGLRYFAGKTTATASYDFTDEFSAFVTADKLVLPKPAWSDPYRSTTAGGYPYCSRPFELVIADAPSFDTDQLPGVDGNFGSGIGSDIGSLNVAALGDFIWSQEEGEGSAESVFIGQSGNNYDTAPTPKTVTSFGNIRGLAPEEPTRQGGYYAASVGYFGKTTGIRSISSHTVKTDTFGVSLSSPLPTIAIPVPNYLATDKKVITVVPFAKSVGGSGINATKPTPTNGYYQPTNTIVDFFIDTIANTGVGNSGTNCPSSVPTDSAGNVCNGGRPYIKFRINYEDSEYGSDHDMDAIVIYTIKVNTLNQLEINLLSEYEAGGVLHHMGYVITGTTHDGVYLEVRDWNAIANNGYPSTDVDYFLDTPPAFTGTPPAPDSGTGTWKDGIALPTNTTRTFAASTTAASAAFIPHDPLWYAAKWGGFTDSNTNNQLDSRGEWDKDGDGIPDSYFLVTNAGKLVEQLSKTFNEMSSRTSSTAAVAVNSTVLRTESRIYQARFNSGDWTGELRALSINQDTGAIESDPATGKPKQIWQAQVELSKQNYDTGRQILTFKPSSKKGVPFRWPGTIPTDPAEETGDDYIDRVQVNVLNGSDGKGKARLNYLRGDSSNEDPNGNKYRKRTVGTVRNVLGDIVNSNPFYVGKPAGGYDFGDYSKFVEDYKSRIPMIYIGANDGMLHGFNADTGAEIFAYVPSKVFSDPNSNLNTLTELTYKNPKHQFYVDGAPTVVDVQFSDQAWHTVLVGGLRSGGKSYFALDVTDPNSVTEDNAKTNVLWEFTDDNDHDLGLSFTQPSLVRIGDSDASADNNPWVVIFGNGYNSSNIAKTPVTDPVTPATTAVLFVLNVETGAVIKKFDLREGQGLSTPSVVDGDEDGIADFVYAGDMDGNLWRFDIRKADPKQWTYVKLFTAKDPNGKEQPITAAPQVAIHPKRNADTVPGTELDELTYIVLFGTGRYLGITDILNNVSYPFDQQTFYGVWDDMDGGSCPGVTMNKDMAIATPPMAACFTRTDLQAQIYCPGNPVEPTCQNSTGTITSSGEFSQDGETYRITSNRCVEYGNDGVLTEKQCKDAAGKPLDLPQKRGWYLDLKSLGERVPGDSLLLGSRILFTSILPDSDPCAYGGNSWLNIFKAVSGQRIDGGTFLSKTSGRPVAEGKDTASGSETGFAPSSVGLMGIASAPNVMKSPDQGKSIVYLSTSGNQSGSEDNIGFFPIKDSEIGRQSWRQLEFFQQ